MRTRHRMILLWIFLLLAACGPIEPSERDELPQTPGQPTAPTSLPGQPTPPPVTLPTGQVDKWSLWTNGTQLRGADIWQRRVYPELDGTEFLGPGPLGPPYTQRDFDRLAALGANYVNISHPGLFTEAPPYVPDPDTQENLDLLLNMIAQADMFAVISFRTGPGRSEFTFVQEDLGDWFDRSYINEAVWTDPLAQEAWAEMWRHTAERYRDNPIVVGYDLMVEPNANDLWGEIEIWEPDEFHADYAGTSYDWNEFYPRMTSAIRTVDVETPILVGATGYSGVEWLPYLQPTGDSRTVYMVHQYAPHHYTHQWWADIAYGYPDEFDTDWDGEDDEFDRDWLADLLAAVDDFSTAYQVPVAVNEFGVIRWVPGAAAYMDDLMDLFEQRGMNHALWVWDPTWASWTEDVNAFNFRFGPDPDNVQDRANELQDVIVKYWARNTVRPSTLVPSAPVDPSLGEPPTVAGCPIFPADNVWNVPIDTLPVDAKGDHNADPSAEAAVSKHEKVYLAEYSDFADAYQRISHFRRGLSDQTDPFSTGLSDAPGLPLSGPDPTRAGAGDPG